METTEDGASLFGKKAKARRAKRKAARNERQQERKAKRHKKRTDRRRFGRGKKGAAAKAEFQAENKAIAEVTAQGAQDLSNNAALPGNGGGESYDFGSGSTQQAVNFGSSMHADGRKYDNVPNMSVPAHKLQRIQGASMKYNGKTLTSSSKQAPAKTGMKTVDPRSSSLKMTSKSAPSKKGIKTGKTKKIVGENTSEIKKDSRGKDYSLIMEGPMKGDTIRPGNAPRIDNYIQGGDYKVKNMGNKNYKIKGGASMSGESYDAKQAYNKNLSSKARLHYLENNIADKKSSHPILKHMRKF